MKYTKRFYVVFKGRVPGIYEDYNDAMDQVDGFEGASFKSFATAEEAAVSYRKYTSRTEENELGALMKKCAEQSAPDKSGKVDERFPGDDYFRYPEIDLNGWAVDASCSGNPGIMEYRGVELMSGREIFRVGPFNKGTNNIGEFLAIVHALALMQNRGEVHTIYSDSVTGMSWVRNRKVKTQLKRDASTEPVFRLMERALSWLNTHYYSTKIMKWDTDRWGEVPADFGRKGTSR